MKLLSIAKHFVSRIRLEVCIRGIWGKPGAYNNRPFVRRYSEFLERHDGTRNGGYQPVSLN